MFSSQWPIAISLVIVLLQSAGVLDNARELYVSPVSTHSKNRLLPPSNISVRLQCGATSGRRAGGGGVGGGGGRGCGPVYTCSYLQETVSVKAAALVSVCVEIRRSEGVCRVLQLKRTVTTSVLFFGTFRHVRVLL